MAQKQPSWDLRKIKDIDKMRRMWEAMGDVDVKQLDDHTLRYDGCIYHFSPGGWHFLSMDDPMAAFRASSKKKR